MPDHLSTLPRTLMSAASRAGLSARRLFARRDGAVAPIFALLSVVLLGLAGGVIDYSASMQQRAKLQAILDTALLAGARDGTEGWITVAQQSFDSMSASAGLSVKSRSFTKAADVYSATATGQWTSTILPVVSVGDFEFTVGSEAGYGAGGGTAGAACIYVLDTTKSETLRLNSGPNITTDCEIHVKSAKARAAVFNSGLTVNVPRFCIEATQILDNSKGAVPNISLNCRTEADPFAARLPATPAIGACSSHSGKSHDGDVVTLWPGTYCNDTNINKATTVTFKDGLYVIKGKINVNKGTVVGDNVTFFMADGNANVHFNSNVEVTFKAPTTGAYAGFLFFETPGGSTRQWTFDPGKHTFEGILYLPNRQLTFNSGTSLGSDKIAMVVSQLVLNGTTWSIQNYSPPWTTTTSSTSGLFIRK